MRETSADFLALVPDVRTSEIKSLSAENRDETPECPVGEGWSNPREIVGEARNAGANNGGSPRKNTLRINKLRI